MTQALNDAFAKLAELAPEEQDRFAQWVLAELADEREWDRQFSQSRDLLRGLADEALADEAGGRATDLDPDRM